MVIDFQAHLFPEEYLNEMARIQGSVVLEAPDPDSGMSYFYDKQLKCRINTATFQGRDPDRRVEHMDRLGIDLQVLSVPPPGADRFEPEAAVLLARKANDALAGICKKYPRRFAGLFSLPTSSIQASLDELERMEQQVLLALLGHKAPSV